MCDVNVFHHHAQQLIEEPYVNIEHPWITMYDNVEENNNYDVYENKGSKDTINTFFIQGASDHSRLNRE